jgi:hypothetical protein
MSAASLIAFQLAQPCPCPYRAHDVRLDSPARPWDTRQGCILHGRSCFIITEAALDITRRLDLSEGHAPLWTLWLAWTIVSTFAFLIGGLLALFVFFTLRSLWLYSSPADVRLVAQREVQRVALARFMLVLSGMAAGSINALIGGLPHYRSLNHQQLGSWVLASVLGAGFAVPFTAVLIDISHRWVDPTSLANLVMAAIFVALGGSIAGFAQWLVLRKTIEHAGLWIVATGTSWLILLMALLSLATALGL